MEKEDIMFAELMLFSVNQEIRLTAQSYEDLLELLQQFFPK